MALTKFLWSQDRNYQEGKEGVFEDDDEEKSRYFNPRKIFSFLLLAYVKLWSLTFLRSTKDHPEVISSNRDYNNARMPIDIIQLLLLTYF